MRNWYRALWGVLAVVFLGLAPAAAAGGEEGSPLTLTAAVTKTLETSPRLQAARARTEVVAAQGRQHTYWPNPSVTAEYEEFGGDRTWFSQSETTLWLEQAFPVGGRTGAGERLAAADEAAAAAEARALARKLVLAVTRDYLEALAAQEAAELAVRSLELSEHAHRLVTARTAAGAQPGLEVSRSQAALATAQAEVQEARALAASRRARLAQHWGGTPGEVTGVADDLPEPTAPPSLAESLAAIDTAPLLAPWAHKEKRARREAELAEREAVPDLSVAAGVRGAAGWEKQTFVFAVGMPIPLLNRNQGTADAARAQARREAWLGEAARAGWRADVAATHAELKGAWERYRLLSEKVLPATQAAFGAVQTGYREGELKTLDLLDARREVVAVEKARLDARSAWRRAKARLEYLRGE